MYRHISEIKESQKRVPTISIANERQAEILANMYYAGCSYIGGLENTISDCCEDDSWYINAKKALDNHDHLVGTVRDMCMDGYYGLGLDGPQRAYQKHYKFEGNEFIDKCAEAVVQAMGY